MVEEAVDIAELMLVELERYKLHPLDLEVVDLQHTLEVIRAVSVKRMEVGTLSVLEVLVLEEMAQIELTQQIQIVVVQGTYQTLQVQIIHTL
jgi:hypothetical protein